MLTPPFAWYLPGDVAAVSAMRPRGPRLDGGLSATLAVPQRRRRDLLEGARAHNRVIGEGREQASEQRADDIGREVAPGGVAASDRGDQHRPERPRRVERPAGQRTACEDGGGH